MECGYRLERLSMEDMLDVVHYVFETDSIGEKEELDARRSMRSMLYRELYGRAYTWGQTTTTADEWGTNVTTANGRAYVDKSSSPSVPAGPPVLEHKPFIPPTPVNADAPLPFGNALDPPMG